MSATTVDRVQVLDPVWIELSDGARLCARVWLPESAGSERVPGIVELLPYRKDDVHALEDAMLHPYYAARGYGCVRVDLRGSGDSDGVLTDEYSAQEHRDALEVIEWVAGQSWCTGAVGMTGISWSGFNSLQVAALRPPALKAIITACSTDDRYDNDVHYLGGVPLGYYLLPRASAMMAFNVRPTDPAIVGDRWRKMWLERLEGNVYL
ncbi:MAG: CocE/NonD family hydrolase, partial [Solirubrobacteraceae bacterium]